MISNFFQLINIVLVLGFPATGAIVFGFTRDPIQAALGMTIYAVFAVVVAIGQRMNERFVEDTGDYLYDAASAPFRSHHKRYVKYLEDRYTFLNLKGTGDRGTFDPELHDVFVNLRVVEVDDTGNLRRSLILDRKTTGDVHDIWHFVKQSEYKHLAILGPPGSGKTTIMQHIVMTLTIPRLRRKVRAPRKIPIFLFLREHASGIKENPEISVVALVNKRLETMVSKLHPDWIERQLHQGNCLILLDGLDEVSEDDTRRIVSQWVRMQIENYPDNHFYVSSRPGGYEHDIFRGSGIHVIDVQTFNREQQESFIYKWYLVNESRQKNLDIKDSKVVLAAREGKDHFFKQVQRVSALADMASNPLLLTLMAILHSWVGSIPAKRSELYKQIFDVLLQKRQQAKGIPDDKLSNEQKLQVLKPLAFYIMKRASGVDISVTEAKQEVGDILGRVDSSVEMGDFLKTIYHGSGLMNPHQVENLYRFSHKTFMEYLTALYIKDNLQQTQLLSTLVIDIGNEWWHETIRLYCTMSDATPVIEACIEAINPDAKELDFAPLMIGIECLAERASVDRDVETAFHQKVANGMESRDDKHARYFREGRLKLRLNSMIPVDDNIAVSSDGVTNAEYALFLEDNPVYHDFCMPDNWQNGLFPAGSGNEAVQRIHPLAGVLFAIWLSRQDEKGQYRIPGSEDAPYFEHLSKMLFLKRYGGGGDLSRLFKLFARKLNRASYLSGMRDFNLSRYPTSSLDFALIHATVIALDHILFNASDLTSSRDLTRILKRANDLANTIDHDSSRIISQPIDLDHAISQALALDHAISQAFNYASELIPKRDIAHDLDLVKDISHIRSLASYLGADMSIRKKKFEQSLPGIFFHLFTASQIFSVLLALLEGRMQDVEKGSAFALYFIAHFAIEMDWIEDGYESEIERYLMLLEAIHTGASGQGVELDDVDREKELWLIREFVTEKSEEKL